MNMKSLMLLPFLLLAACSDDITGASGEKGSTSHEKTPAGSWNISGVSQKGPFVTGSTVNIMELDSLTLEQTGKIFKSTIRSDEGDFIISGQGFSSPYAMIQVKGYYRNEITGKRSSGPLTLNAFTDLSHREKVNVNLLTHLEFERVKLLVSQGKSFKEAKTQAANEVLAAMAMNDASKSFEDLDIFKSGDENAKLLAISALMQGDVDVAGLTERVGKFSMELAESGSWNDSATRTVIADWACEVSQRRLFDDIRANILSWKISDSLPDFEKFVDYFWTDNYGLGTCSATNDGDTTANVNPLSIRNGEKFVCENGHWESTEKNSGNYKGIFGTMTDARDGQTYKTVQIGDQVWMAENLNYDYHTLQTFSMCYNKDPQKCDEYGRLYSLAAAVDSAGLFGDGGVGCGRGNVEACKVRESLRGVCPEGWHLPSESEWMQLLVSLGGVVEESETDEVYPVKASGFNIDDSGFNNHSGGCYYPTGGFSFLGCDKYWTSSSRNIPSILELNSQNASAWDTGWALSSFFYVRCVKD